MNTVSANQNMSQPNEQDNFYELSVTTMKRKRGRPRKYVSPRKKEVSGSEPKKRSKQGPVLRSPSFNHSLVGQEVSCSFTGVFDAGYLLTVQVGSSGPTLTGVVFDPRLSVPVSAENDIAPHLPMLRRHGFAPPVGVINQGAGGGSSQAGTAQNAGLTQHIQAKESPTTSSFTSNVQTNLQLNMMKATPDQNSHAPQTTSEALEPQNIPKTMKFFLEGTAIETSDQSPLASSYHPQSQAKSEHAPISAELSDFFMERPPASKTPNGYNPSVLSMVPSSEVSTPSNVPGPSEAPEALNEHLNIPKEALSTTHEVPFDISNPCDMSEEADFVVWKPSEASANAQKINLNENKSSVGSGHTASEPTHVLEQQTLGDIAADNLSSEKSSQRTEEPLEDPKVDESLGDGGSHDDQLVLDMNRN